MDTPPDALPEVESGSSQPERPEYLTIEEAADLIRTPVSTLYQWRHQKKGPPARKVGRRLIYSRAKLIAWVESDAAA